MNDTSIDSFIILSTLLNGLHQDTYQRLLVVY